MRRRRAGVALLLIATLAAGPGLAQPKPDPKPLPAVPINAAPQPLTLDAAFTPDFLPIEEIDRVLYRTRTLTIIDAFGMGSLRQTGDVYVLLRDGTAFLHDWSFPVTDLDTDLSRTHEPEKWFRWNEGTTGPVLMRTGGPAAGEALDLSDAQRLLPMPLGQPFDHAWFSVDAASGPRPSDNAYRFASDGYVQHVRGSPTFAMPDNVIIRAAAPEVMRSRYRFEGYALILSTIDGEERHFFAVFDGGGPGAPPPAGVIDGGAYFTP